MNELQRLLASNAAFTPPARIVDAIPSQSWVARPSLVPHSMVEELWHIVYWMDYFLRCARGESAQYPVSSEEGWKRLDGISEDELSFVLARFREGLSEAFSIAASPTEVLSTWQTTLREPGMSVLTMQELLINLAVHNAYHLGRIVLIRQMLGIWPPPGGGDRW